MSIKKIWLYGRLSLLALIVFVLLVFMTCNSDRVTIKFFNWEIWQAPVFAVIISSASLGATLTLFSRTIMKLFKELKLLRQEEREKKQKQQDTIKVNDDHSQKE